MSVRCCRIDWGFHGCPAFSMEAACTGFIYALSVADKFVRLGEAKCALVVGAETLTRIIDWNDRGTCVLFADGAGAVVLQPSSEPGIISTRLHSDGKYKDLLDVSGRRVQGLQAGARRQGRRADEGQRGLQGRGQHAGTPGDRDLERQQYLPRQQLDWLIPHQANIRIIEAIAKRLDLPMERVIVTIDTQGNTSAASVPLALDTGIRDGRVQARAAAAARGVRRRIYLGIGADSLLSGPRKEKRRGVTAAFKVKN